MLVLSRKVEEGIRIGDTIEIKVLNVTSTGDSGRRRAKVASIGIEAPRELTILRGELKRTVQENIQAEKTTRNLSGLGLADMLKKKRSLDPPKE